jgi:predicted PurR-regulated permease PerM
MGERLPATTGPANPRYLVSTAPSEAADPDPGSSAAANAPKRRLVRIDVTGGAVTKIVIGLLALGVVGHLFEQMRDLFVWTLTATFLAIALNPLVERLQPRIGRKSASTVVVIGFALAFLGILVALIAPFVTQVDELSTALPEAISEAQHNSTVQRLDDRFHLAQHAKEHLDSLPNVIFGAADTILAGAFAISTIFFLTLFLLYELPNIGNVILTQIPPSRRPRARAAAQHVNKNIGGYVAGNLVISVICGVVTTVSLYLLDVPYSLALGVFMAVLDIIPLVGATIGMFVVVAAGLIFVDMRTAVILFVIVMIYQQIENHILQPMIYGRTVQIPSLTILISVLAGGAALGLVGALLAIPVAATIQAVVVELLEERALQMDELSSGDA